LGQTQENSYIAIQEHYEGTDSPVLEDLWARVHRGSESVDVDLGWCGSGSVVGIVDKAQNGTQAQFDTACEEAP